MSEHSARTTTRRVEEQVTEEVAFVVEDAPPPRLEDTDPMTRALRSAPNDPGTWWSRSPDGPWSSEPVPRTRRGVPEKGILTVINTPGRAPT